MRVSFMILRLAAHDFKHEWRVSACLVLALATVLTPLLVLFGLKFGLIEVMTTRLLEDTRNLEIRPIGSGNFTPDWFGDMRARPDVAFVIPRTRSIATTVKLTNPGGPRGTFVTAELVPTAPGDPLLGELDKGVTDNETAVLSAAAARRLGLVPGDKVVVVVGRVRETRHEGARVVLGVSAILPESRFLRPAAFVALPVLNAVERYRDGFSAAIFGAEGEPPPEGPRSFASYRLYARALGDIPALRDDLEAQGLEIHTNAAAIELVQSMDRNLSAVFWILASIAILGLLLSLASSLWANVERKLGALSTLRLIGFPSAGLVFFPVAQAVLVCILGALLAAGLYLGIELVLNRVFAASLLSDEVVTRLLPRHFMVMFSGTLVFGLAASVLSALRVAAIEPGEKLRDV